MEGGRSSLSHFPEGCVATARLTVHALAQIALECERQARMPSEGAGRIAVLQGTLDLIVLRTLESMGPQHAYAIATRLQQVSGDRSEERRVGKECRSRWS